MSKGCKFNLTLNTFGSVKSQMLERFATTSLYKRRGEMQLLEAVIKSNQTALEENRRKIFFERKNRMLREFRGKVNSACKLSPTS